MNAPVQYPVQLGKVIFTRSIVVAVPTHEPKQGGVLASAPVNEINVSPHPEAPHSYVVTMQSTLNKDGLATDPYRIEMECFAILTCDGSLSPEDELKAVTINGHSVCYGAIREAVLWLTSRQPYGSVTLGLSLLPSGPRADK